jgi:hypothetical protein
MGRPRKVHHCVRCLALPTLEEWNATALAGPLVPPCDPRTGIDVRPVNPRPALKGTPANPLCATHDREKRTEDVAKRRASRANRVYGVPGDEQADLLTFQLGACACGRISKDRGLVMDHDHACCPTTPACGKCATGYVCWQCNMDTIGKLERMHRQTLERTGGDPDDARGLVALSLLNLASHLLDPPLDRLRRGEATPYMDVCELAELLGDPRTPETTSVA